MNETMQTLLSRRSIRSYQKRQISDRELNDIMQAGIWAPSGMNQQSSRFVVIQNAGVREKLFRIASDFPNRGGNPFYGAPTVILVFADKKAITPVQDASLSIGNMANAAASLGIGSCWINCVYDLFTITQEGKQFKKELLSDNDFEPVGALALGYSAETAVAKSRKENRVIYFK